MKTQEKATKPQLPRFKYEKKNSLGNSMFEDKF